MMDALAQGCEGFEVIDRLLIKEEENRICEAQMGCRLFNHCKRLVDNGWSKKEYEEYGMTLATQRFP